jgi:hypothetical protein
MPGSGRQRRSRSAGQGSTSSPHIDELMVPATANTPLRELIVGLDDVADWAIPYAQLPRRTGNAYSPAYRRWSDVANQTVHSLRRPYLAESTVRPLLLAARDAVAKHKRATNSERVGAAAAVRQLLDDLDDRDRAILWARLFTPRPLTQGVVAQRLGIAKMTVQRQQRLAEAKLAELLAEPAHHEVSDHTAALGRRLGPYLPADVVVTELRRLDVDLDSEAARVLLHLAGRYVPRGEWFENTTTGGERHAAGVVDDVFARRPAPTTEMLVQALADIGMPADVAATYVQTRAGWRCFDDLWVRWGDFAASRTEAVLHVSGAPATAEDVWAAIGPGPTTLKSVRDALSRDQRFVRTSRQTWGLRAWGLDEYTGIAEQICASIDAAGGQMNVDELIHDLRSRFPDVAESSIKITLTTLAFVTEGGMVRRRRDTDEWPAVAPLRTVRGAFRNGHNEIRLATTATSEALRGSGRPLHPAVATALGVGPGQRRSFSSPHGPLEVAWRLSSTQGSTIGSVRVLAEHVGAGPTDTLVLAFNLDEDSLHVTRIGAEVAGMDRLRRLLGRIVRSPGAALAASLGCRRTDVAAVLRKRGDDDLADLVDSVGGTE